MVPWGGIPRAAVLDQEVGAAVLDQEVGAAVLEDREGLGRVVRLLQRLYFRQRTLTIWCKTG